MKQFLAWLESINPGGKFTFVSDNPAFDWQFINYYFYSFVGHNPFGFSARRIGDIYSGWKGNVQLSGEWRQFRKTAHTHDPLDDAKGNAEALLALNDLGLKMPIIAL